MSLSMSFESPDSQLFIAMDHVCTYFIERHEVGHQCVKMPSEPPLAALILLWNKVMAQTMLLLLTGSA